MIHRSNGRTILCVTAKKVCGILTEMSAQIDYINYIVVGVGINVSNEVFPEEVASTATSLYLLTGVTCSRAKLISEIMAQFEIYYAQISADAGSVRTYERI